MGAVRIEYVVALRQAQVRSDYIREHPLHAVSVVFPPAFILLLPRIIRRLTADAKSRFGSRVRVYTMFLTISVVMLGSVMVVIAEKASPNANIKNFGDGLWWSMETISTVGYGDFYPVTILGRCVAVLLFINGVALLSVVTATVASSILDSSSEGEEDTDETGRKEFTMDDLRLQLLALNAKIDALAASEERPPGTSPAPPP